MVAYRKRQQAALTASKVARQGTGGQTQKNQIMSLTRSVRSLRRKRQQDQDWTQYRINQSINIATPYNVWDLGKLADWGTAFGPTPTGQVMLRKLEYDLQFTCNNENSAITFSCFLVGLRPQTCSQLIENVGEGLGSMTENIHYTRGPASNGGQGQVYINPEFFKIFKTHRFQISSDQYRTTSEPARNQLGTVKRYNGHINMNKRLLSGRAEWDPSQVSTMPQEYRMYWLVFNDNSALDGLFPVMTGSGLWHVSST